MKKTFKKIIILFSIVFILGSCSDPIFFIVSKEIPILKPFINGSPTNFVVYNGELYVATGKQIYSYNGDKWSKWDKGSNLNGRIVGLAATTGASASLYALYLNKDSDDGRIRDCKNGSDLILSKDQSTKVQSIYAVEDVLFACVRNDDNIYKIHFKKGTSDFAEIPGTFSSTLNGVASDSTYYYLCIYQGIYYAEKSQIDDPSTLPDTLPVLEKDKGFTGIIELKNNYVAAITNEGILYEINDLIIREAAKFTDSRYSTGALALWYRDINDTMPSLLLAGRKEIYYSTSSAYTNGYVEITLDTTEGNPAIGRISGSGFSDPGKGAPSSIDDYEHYVSSFGKKPVNHIIQTPKNIDPKMTLFASTQQDGVWSYKDRGNGEIWNAEQNK